ncbi:MAG: Gfo/Idh/MocA family oxidoreductase [Cyanobacteria bacterium]|nr:Gfo/Idh/MocA family oxidoreductase [Cyanobacteriota bacterium]
MKLAFVGCGFVADYYVRTLENYPHLELLGVMDRDRARADKFSAFYGVPTYGDLDSLLKDDRVDLVVNLTNPRSHFEVSQAALAAGKHVYSEKPLAMAYDDALALVEQAEASGLCLSSAPCSLLGETAQGLWKALRENAIGQVYLTYAEMDDGLVHRMPYEHWKSESGTPWPYKDEFEVGCTLEHAGYYLTWLPAFFGPARSVTAFSACLVKDKKTAVPLEQNAPDFSVACIQFESGMVARLTCGIVAPHDHELRIFGEEGVMYMDDCWDYRSPIHLKRFLKIRRKMLLNPLAKKYPLPQSPYGKLTDRGAQAMDFCRGIAEMADAIAAGRSPRLSARYCLHVNEMVLAIQNALDSSAPYHLKSTFDPIAPMPWAE